MANAKPYVSIAACCEKVLIERDGVVSAIRLVDTFFVGESPPGTPAGVLPIHVLVSLRSDGHVGSGTLSIGVESPDGKITALPESWPLLLAEPAQGANIVVNLMLGTAAVGQYWIHVLWENELLSKIPIRLARGPARASAPAQNSP